MKDVIFALWFFLPAGVANASPVFANKIPLLNKWKTPMDFGKSFGKKRVLGDNKTWRGVLTGTVMGGLVGLVTFLIYPDSASQLWIDPVSPAFMMFVAGCTLGFGGLIGDAVESFFKRRANVKPGQSWFPFDQIDFVVGGLLFVTPFVNLEAIDYLVIPLTWFGLHLVTAYIGYLLKLKDKPI